MPRFEESRRESHSKRVRTARRPTLQLGLGLMAVQIPQGLTAGQSFQIEVPPPPQAAQPVMAQAVIGQPVPMQMEHG